MHSYASKFEAVSENEGEKDFQPDSLPGSVWSTVWKDPNGEAECIGLLRFLDSKSARLEWTLVRAAPQSAIVPGAATTEVLEWCPDSKDVSGRGVLMKGTAVDPPTVSYELDEYTLSFAAGAGSFSGITRGCRSAPWKSTIEGRRVVASRRHWTVGALQSVSMMSCAHVAVLITGVHIPLTPMETASAAAERRSWADSFALAGGPEIAKVGSGLREHAFICAVVDGTGDGLAQYESMVRACGGGEERGAVSEALHAVWAAVLKHSNAVHDAIVGLAASGDGGAVPAVPARLSRLWTRVLNVREFLLTGRHRDVVQAGESGFWSSMARARALFLVGLLPHPSSARTLYQFTAHVAVHAPAVRDGAVGVRYGDHLGMDSATAVVDFVCDSALSLPDLVDCMTQRNARAVCRAAALTTAASTIRALADTSPIAQLWMVAAVSSAVRAVGGHPLAGVSGCTLGARTKLTRAFGDFLAAMNRIVSREVCLRVHPGILMFFVCVCVHVFVPVCAGCPRCCVPHAHDTFARSLLRCSSRRIAGMGCAGMGCALLSSSRYGG